jgi:hypothetical protein
LIAKIENKVLDLTGYQMNIGLSVALGKAFTLYDDVIEKLLLESTSMDDPMFGAILEGLSE